MISSFFAGILGLLYLKISFATIRTRRKNKISLGTGSSQKLQHLVSAHSNFASYSIFLLFLMFLLEQPHSFIPWYILTVVGILFTCGRIFHFWAFSKPTMDFKLRTAGMILTLFPLSVLSILNLIQFITLLLKN